MKRPKPDFATVDAWADLRRLTAARIALGRAGSSLPTRPHLEFQLAHARARDAVHAELDSEALAMQLRAAGHETLLLASAAPDRATYLQRPDLGRALSPQSRALLERRRKPEVLAGAAPATPRYDVAFVIADGLSALAATQHAGPLLAEISRLLAGKEWTIAPLAVVNQGRVAIADEIGECLGAGIVVMLIGERPGLSTPDSLGIYLTYAPKVGRTDAQRNCISNIRGSGQSPKAAAATLFYLLTEARRRRISGTGLKDETVARPVVTSRAGNFLLPPGKINVH